jgi:O-antigen ligase
VIGAVVLRTQAALQGLRRASVPPGAAIAGAGLATAGLLGVGIASAPYLVMGTAVGAALLLFAIMQPLGVVSLMLVIGPADLSVITGGFKGMLREFGGLDMNGIRLVAMSAALGLIVMVERSVGRELFRPSGIFYGAVVVWCALTLAWTPSLGYGARLLLKIAYPLLVYLVIVGMVTRREQLERMMDAVLVGAVFLCVVVQPMYLAFGDFERQIGDWIRLRGVGIHQNPFAFYLLVALLIAFVRFTTRRQARYLVLCAICSFWMVLTIARIAFLATVVSFATLGILAALVTRQTRVLIGAAVVASLIAIPFAPPVLARTFGFVPTPGELLGLLTDPRALYMAINWEGRQTFWIFVYQAFMTTPLIGLGLGGSSFLLALQFPMFTDPIVHNDYLRLLADAGLIGFALFACAMMAWLFVSYRAAQVPDHIVREYAFPAVACIAAMAVVSITDNAFDYYGSFTQFVGFLCGGAAAAAACARRTADGSGPEPAAGSP